MASHLAPVVEDVAGELSSPEKSTRAFTDDDDTAVGRSVYTGGTRGGERPTSAGVAHRRNQPRDVPVDHRRYSGASVAKTAGGSVGGRRPRSAPFDGRTNRTNNTTHTDTDTQHTTNAGGSTWSISSPASSYIFDRRPHPPTSSSRSPYGTTLVDGGGRREAGHGTSRRARGGGGGGGGMRVGAAECAAEMHAARHRVGTTVAALLTREKEELAEEVLELRRRQHEMETRLKLATTDALRASAEVRRRDRELLAMEKERQARNLQLAVPSSSGAGGAMVRADGKGGGAGPEGTSRAASDFLVKRLKERVGELKATVRELSAELDSARTSARATRVNELEAQNQVYLSEVVRLSKILQQGASTANDRVGSSPRKTARAAVTPRGSKKSNPLLEPVAIRRNGGGSAARSSSAAAAAVAAADETIIALSSELEAMCDENGRLSKEISQLKVQLAFGLTGDDSASGADGVKVDGEALAVAEEKAEALEARSAELFAQLERLRQDKEHFRRLAAMEAAAAAAAQQESGIAKGEAKRTRTALALMREQVVALGEQLEMATRDNSARLMPPPSPLSPHIGTPRRGSTSPARSPAADLAAAAAVSGVAARLDIEAPVEVGIGSPQAPEPAAPMPDEPEAPEHNNFEVREDVGLDSPRNPEPQALDPGEFEAPEEEEEEEEEEEREEEEALNETLEDLPDELDDEDETL